MDDRDNTSSTPNVERTAEEVAWDEEFKDSERSDSVASTLGGLAALAVRIPVALVQASVELVPDETRRHTRAAARESFLAMRSLLGAMGDGIERMLTEPEDRQTRPPTTVSGPPGTWGTARATRATDTTSKARRISVEDTDANGTSNDGETREGRGLRADIDY